MNLWGGRFSQRLAPDAWDLNTSLKFDQRLGPQDIRGSQAWARALERASILSGDECAQICDGLEAIGKEFETQEFAFQESDEDIHTAVERRLGEIIGPLAGKLHTGRSRNDQVATDLRLWILEHLPNLEDAIDTLQGALVTRADKDMNVRMPGYTHLQRAQPILLSHWWLSHFWPLQRDRERLGELAQRVAQLPLGSGALAGTPYPIDRAALATDLGFEEASLNSIDAVSDRDFAAEFLFCAALTGLHLSKLAEAMVLFSSAEFGFFELSDAYATGSSLMPQKKNPDVFELTRAKAGTLIGYLTGLMTTLKGLPSTYDKDLQEDKVPVFSAFDTLTAVLPVLANALGTLTINPKRMEHGIDASMMATDLADYLVKKGIPFREAHEVVGKAVQYAIERGKSLDALSQAEFQAIHPEFSPDVYGVFDPANSLSRRNSSGGTAPKAVEEQIQSAKETIGIN
ncbi:MAG: argininosuccinate lyase [Anaerolineales bacterium]|jgi:argininosuccinate lyase